MRLLILTNRDIESNLMLNLLLPKLTKKYKAHIFLSDKVGKFQPQPMALQDLKFFEQNLINDLFFPALESQNRSLKGHLLTFKELAQYFEVNIESLNDVKSSENLSKIRDLKPDLVLSVRYGKIFGNDFISIPSFGVINLHSGLLPNYRGVLATFRALMNGDVEIGTTLHYIDDATIDTGKIIGFAKVSVSKEKSLLEHILSLYPASVDLVIDTIEQIFAGQNPSSIIQKETNATYFTFPTAEEIDIFARKGWIWVNKTQYLTFLKRYMNSEQGTVLNAVDF